MKTIKTHNNIELIIAEVPEDDYDFFIHITSIMGRTVENKLTTFYKEDCFDLPNCWQMTYKILGKLSELPEEECSRFVGLCKGYGYRNYNKDDYNGGSSPFDVWAAYHLKTAKESLISLLKSNGVDTTKNLLIIEKI